MLEGSLGEALRSGEAAVPATAMEAGKVLDQAAVAQALRSLVARCEISSSRALVAVSDQLASFRVLTFPRATTEAHISAVVGSELNLGADRLSARHVEVPLTRDEKTVFAVTWDRAQVDAIASAVRRSGLEPVAVDLVSLCLARALAVDDCVLVDSTVQPAEVLLIERRIPRLRHTFKLDPDGDQAKLIAAAVRTVVGFRMRGDADSSAPDAPVIVRSADPLSTTVSGRIRDITGRRVLPVPRPPRVDEDLRFGPFLACIGLVMRRSA